MPDCSADLYLQIGAPTGGVGDDLAGHSDCVACAEARLDVGEGERRTLGGASRQIWVPGCWDVG